MLHEALPKKGPYPPDLFFARNGSCIEPRRAPGKARLRRLRVLLTSTGIAQPRTGRYQVSNGSTSLRVIARVDATGFDQLAGLWALGQEPSVLQTSATGRRCFAGSRGGGPGKPR